MSEPTDFSALMSFDAEPAAPLRPAGGADAVVGQLIERLAQRPDFPSLGTAMGSVRRLARQEQTRLQTLSDALLTDVGLAHRVLRMANAAHYRAAGAGEVTNLSRAIAVMGFDEISRLALSSRLIDQIRGHRHSQVLRQEFLRALLAGALAHHLAQAQPWAEDAHVAAVFRNLGRLLCGLHFTDDALAVRADLSPELWPRTVAEQQASRHRLGVSYDSLGQRLAERWGWPAALRRAMQQPADRRQLGRWPRPDDPHFGLGEAGPLPPHTPMVCVLASVANELADLMVHCPPATWAGGCAQLAHPQGWSAGQLAAALQAVGPELDRLGLLLELPLDRLPAWDRAAQRPLPPTGKAVDRSPEPAVRAPGALAARVEGRVEVDGAPAAAGPAPSRTATVARRPPPMSGTVLPEQELVDRLQALLGARRVVLCIRDLGRGDLIGRHVCSPGLGTVAARFVVPTDDAHDLFATLAAWGSDTLIRDSSQSAIASRLPHWWDEAAGGGSFLVMPLRQGTLALGLVYAECAGVGELQVEERQRQPLRHLRDLAWQLCRDRVLPAGSGRG